MGKSVLNRRALVIGGLVGVGGLGVAAAGLGLAPSSRDYRPVSEREDAALRKANRDIYPADVRKTPDAFKTSLVAWAGIIRGMDVSEEKDAAVIRFDVEHRYFDWLEDNSVRSAKYLLAKRGEGQFRAAWSVPLSQRDVIRKEVRVGDMVVVYGVPSEIRGDTIGLFPTESIRAVKAELYDDKVLDYGRDSNPGERA